MVVVRLSKVVVCGGLLLFALLIAANNLINYDANWEFVRRVMSMDTIGVDPDVSDRAITSVVLHRTVYALIILFQCLTALAFLIAFVAMLRTFLSTRKRFQRAKALTAIGISLVFVTWFVAFMLVGGEWFLMIRSPEWNGQQQAFQYAISVLVAGIYILIENDGDRAVHL